MTTNEKSCPEVHPDPLINAECEIDRLQGLLYEARAGLVRALQLRAATPLGLAIKRDIRSALMRTGGLFLDTPGDLSAARALKNQEP